MAQSIRSVMTVKPLALHGGTTLVEAARAMRDHDVGNVLVLEDDQLKGIVTDRDIVIRGVARGHDPSKTVLAEICSAETVSVTPDDDVDRAVEMMRAAAVRRLPVVEDGRPVAIVS